MVSQKERIQRRLHAEALAGPFYGASYDSETRQITVDTDTEIVPASVIVAEESASFGTPLLHRRTYRHERRSWRFDVRCAFNEEVSTEAFENRMTSAGVFLARDDANDLAQVTLRLMGSVPLHPPQQSPRHGTFVTFTFEAEVAPT
jgi:hypothetical protein